MLFGSEIEIWVLKNKNLKVFIFFPQLDFGPDVVDLTKTKVLLARSRSHYHNLSKCFCKHW